MNFRQIASRTIPVGVLLALGATVSPTPALGQNTITIQAAQRGWVCDAVNYPCAVYGQTAAVQANNGASPTNNVFAGSGLTPNDQGQTFNAGLYRNWFQFAIPKLTGPLSSAVLTLPEPNRWNVQDLQYSIYGIGAQPKVFTDIRGTAYGTVTTKAADFGSIVYLNFNAAGLAAVEGAQGGNLVIGGIDSGETLFGYHGDFSGTGATDTPPNPNVNRNTPLTLTTGNPVPQAPLDATCAAPPPSLNSFVIEHPIDLTKILSTLTPSVPNTFGPVFAGQKEARNRIAYDSTTKILTNEVYLTDFGAPTPTSPTFDILKNRLVYLIVPIDRIVLTCRPRPAVALYGIAADGYPIFGDPAGSPVSYVFGYSMDSPPRIRDVVSLVGGVATVYENTAYAALSFGTVGASISGGPVIVTSSPIITLDATASTGGPLTYSWSSDAYGLAFIDPTSAKTNVWIGAGAGDYVVILKVRNNALGEESSAVATIRYKPN